MEPKNDRFQKECPIPGCHFQAKHVKLWEVKELNTHDTYSFKLNLFSTLKV